MEICTHYSTFRRGNTTEILQATEKRPAEASRFAKCLVYTIDAFQSSAVLSGGIQGFRQNNTILTHIFARAFQIIDKR